MTAWMYRSIKTLAIVLWPLTMAAQPPATQAQPAEIFRPHLERIQQTLPPRFSMRLPSQIRLGGPADDDFIQELTVRVFAASAAPGVTVGLYTCTDITQFCLVGYFSGMSRQSPLAQQLYHQHQRAATPITLSKTIRGYLLEGSKQQPPSNFSSLMWQQDDQYYTVSFAEPERQNMLYMALSMANDSPLISANPIFRDRPESAGR